MAQSFSTRQYQSTLLLYGHLHKRTIKVGQAEEVLREVDKGVGVQVPQSRRRKMMRRPNEITEAYESALLA